jgi:hypothetical protein
MLRAAANRDAAAQVFPCSLDLHTSFRLTQNSANCSVRWRPSAVLGRHTLSIPSAVLVQRPASSRSFMVVPSQTDKVGIAVVGDSWPS